MARCDGRNSGLLQTAQHGFRICRHRLSTPKMPGSATLKHAFPPIAAPDARVLILGSLPGDESIARDQYYAHPTNAFWWLVGEVIDRPLVSMDYPERLAALARHGIALWDVIASAERSGSLDAAIRSATPRDLAAFAGGLPALRAIAFNGGTAARHGRRQLADVAGCYALLDLPSSSAAHAGLARTAKRERWLALRPFLARPAA